MQSVRPKLLIVDDDPSHLEIYGLMVEQAGWRPLPAPVRFAGPEYPPDRDVAVILLDYKLNCARSTMELAAELRGMYPAAPIVLLSDVWTLPKDVAPHVTEFVRKGEPAKLMSTLRRLLGEPNVSA